MQTSHFKQTVIKKCNKIDGIERLVCYKHNRPLEDHDLEFNHVLQRDWQIVERAFGLLKMKWRRLKLLDFFRLENAHTILMVTACLHNFGLQVDEWIEFAPQVRDNNDDEENENFFADEEEELHLVLEKRRRIAEEFED